MLIKDRYRLEEVLGRGGMGEVWRAADTVLDRPVAVKLLTAAHSDQTAVSRFRMEARTAARLSHPNTVAVYDFGAVEERLYLVMELVDGYSLATAVTALHRLDPGQVTDVGAQASTGLAAAHRADIVHRDIKPANLLLTRGGTLKIGDFGIAQFANDAQAGLTGTGVIIGSAPYLAPERALGHPAGPPADMYALGCVLYELLAGQPPFTARTATGVLAQHVNTAPVDIREHRTDMPAPLAAVIRGLLAKEPQDRPTADQVVDWLAPSAQRTKTASTPAAGRAGAPPAAPPKATAGTGRPAPTGQSWTGPPPPDQIPQQGGPRAQGTRPMPAPLTHAPRPDVVSTPSRRRLAILAAVLAATIITAALIAASNNQGAHSPSLPTVLPSAMATAAAKPPSSTGPATPRPGTTRSTTSTMSEDHVDHGDRDADDDDHGNRDDHGHARH